MALQFWKRDHDRHRTVSMRVPLFCMFLIMGILPMALQGLVMGRSFRRTQIDGRVIEVQNQSLITSDRLTRAEYMAAPGRDALLNKELDTIADIFNGRIVIGISASSRTHLSCRTAGSTCRNRCFGALKGRTASCGRTRSSISR